MGRTADSAGTIQMMQGCRQAEHEGREGGEEMEVCFTLCTQAKCCQPWIQLYQPLPPDQSTTGLLAPHSK